MTYKKIVVAGGGILGSRIAFQAAYCGFDVTIWLRSESSIGRTMPKLDECKRLYTEEIYRMDQPEKISEKEWSFGISEIDDFDARDCLKNVEKAYSSVKLELELKKAVEDADLVIESLAEDLEEKKLFYQKLAPLLPERTVIVTNTSTLLPSDMADVTGRPEKFLCLHFANTIWKNNIAEVMGHEQTQPEYFNEIVEFAKELRMRPLSIHKEKAGYLMNSLLMPYMLCALDMLANNVSDAESIDFAWKLTTNAVRGPLETVDKIGFSTMYNIVMQYQDVPESMSPMLKKMMFPYNFKGIANLLEEYMEQGKYGKISGEGFFKYC